MPLSGDATDRFLPWIIGLMVFLAALALAFALGLGGAISRWEQSHGSALTVELPAAVARGTDGRIAAVQAVLSEMPGVVDAVLIDRAEALKLLQPWLGENFDGADLPLPVLIDVRLDPNAAIDLDAVRAALVASVPEARIDSRKGWLAPLIETAATVRTLAFGIVGLIGLVASVTVVFTTTTGLAVHQDAIELLHLTGAQDDFIAQQFQRQALILGLAGGLVGLACAGGLYLLVARVAERLSAPLLPRLTLDPLALAILVALPLVAAGLATIVARFTVMRALSRLP